MKNIVIKSFISIILLAVFGFFTMYSLVSDVKTYKNEFKDTYNNILVNTDFKTDALVTDITINDVVGNRRLLVQVDNKKDISLNELKKEIKENEATTGIHFGKTKVTMKTVSKTGELLYKELNDENLSSKTVYDSHTEQVLAQVNFNDYIANSFSGYLIDALIYFFIFVIGLCLILASVIYVSLKKR